MGLLEDLDYAIKPANRLQNTLQRAAARGSAQRSRRRCIHWTRPSIALRVDVTRLRACSPESL